jgi:cation transport ATPase
LGEAHAEGAAGIRQDFRRTEPEIAVEPSERSEAESMPELPATAEEPSPARPSASRVRLRKADLPRAVTFLGTTAGVMAPSLFLLGPSAHGLRFPLATLAVVACFARARLVEHDPSDIHPLVAALSVGGVWGAALYERYAGGGESLTSVAALAAASQLVCATLVDRAREGVRSARSWIRWRLDVPVRVLRGEPAIVSPRDVKPGEDVVVEVGETVGVDLRVVAGTATVSPWVDAPVEVRKSEGDPIVAGARIVEGRIQGVTTWSSDDRAWAKLLTHPNLRPDVVGPLPLRVRTYLERGTLLGAALVGGLGIANGATHVEAVGMAAVAAFCFAGTWVAGVVGLHQARGALSALAHGVVYRDAAAFDAAGRADVAVLCSRTTLLLGAPEIVAFEPLGSATAARVLEIAAGASTVSPHPASAAILETARSKGATVELVRHGIYHPGLGVTALSGQGEEIAVGNRALLLREKVSVAGAEARISQLEGEGRSVTLVALGGKLIGLLALQDGLRPGARAAVQRLLDAGIEPVLLSGEARDMCETLGRALDIENIRPEILPSDRAQAVRAFADGGHVVAVLGAPASDAGALGAAAVSVALGMAGGTGDFCISLASEDVRDAARALAIAGEARRRTRIAAIVGLTPGGIAVMAIGLGLVPLVLGPLVSVGGLVAAVVHARR